MLKSSGSTLMASFTTINSFILKSNNILPCSMFHRTSTRSKKLCAYTQNHQLHAKGDMVAGRYLPPLFSVAPMMDWTGEPNRRNGSRTRTGPSTFENRELRSGS